ncbi:MAG: polysaccharide deacetylase family protein [Gemmatimonadales bacterium]
MTQLPLIRHARRLGRAATDALRRRSRRGVVLLYHRVAGPRRDPQCLDVSPRNFDAHLAALARSASPLVLDDFEARRRAGTLPARAVAVTFDDGYADNLLAAAPVLARHRVPATVFVTTGLVGANREFWWDDAERIAFAPRLLCAPVPALSLPWSQSDGDSRGLDGDRDRWSVLETVDPTPRHRLYRSMCEALYTLDGSAREERLAEWRAWAGVPVEARPSHRTVTLAELRALAGATGVSIGAHSMTHPVLARLAREDQRRELEESRASLARSLERAVPSVAYPFGTRAEVSRATTEAARDAGFDFAMANESLSAWRWSSRWRVPRVLVRDWDGETFTRQLERWFAA